MAARKYAFLSQQYINAILACRELEDGGMGQRTLKSQYISDKIIPTRQ